MAALTADRRMSSRDAGRLTPAKVKASTTIYGGSLVARLSADGLVQPAADAASVTFAGVAREQVTGNAAGTTQIELYQVGDFEFAIASTTEASVGALVAPVDDQTVGVYGTTTNDIPCGKIVELLSATSVMVRIDGYAF